MKDMPAYDGSFVSYLLQCIFGANVLKNSSAKGGVSNFNGNSHEALDAVKLKFIEGNPKRNILFSTNSYQELF